jgi:hypothetical protein
MRKGMIIGWLVLGFLGQTRAQQFETEQLLLDVEKLAQFKQILQDMKDGYEILVTGYNTIKDLSAGNFHLHDAFLSGLLQVSPTVKNYARIAQIVKMQLQLTQQCKGALRQLQVHSLLSAAEMAYLGNVYQQLLQSSWRNLEDLTTVLTAGQLRMSDHERLQMIDQLYHDMQEKLSFVRFFNGENVQLLLGRAREQKDVHVLGKLSLKK